MILPHYFEEDGPGAALAIVVDGERPRFECRGLVKPEDARPITPETVFDLASVSKTFTAAAIMLLVEQGVLDPSVSIAALLPMIEAPLDGRPITVRDLLWHTSGLTDYLAAGMYTPAEDATQDAIVRMLPEWSRGAHAGVRHDYSNTNYVLLAKIIEAISGVDVAAFVQTHLLQPFDLPRTFVLGSDEADAASTVPGYQNTGYGVPCFEPLDPFVLDTVGDGGIFSSIEDLARWQSLFWQGEIVSAASLAQMQTPGHLDSGETFPYGYGLQVEDVPGRGRWCGHGGSWTQSTTLVGRYPDANMNVLVLSKELMAPVERISQRAMKLATAPVT